MFLLSLSTWFGRKIHQRLRGLLRSELDRGRDCEAAVVIQGEWLGVVESVAQIVASLHLLLYSCGYPAEVVDGVGFLADQRVEDVVLGHVSDLGDEDVLLC